MRTEKEIENYILKVFNLKNGDEVEFINTITNNNGSGILNIGHGLTYTVEILLNLKNWLHAKSLRMTTYSSGVSFDWSI